MKKEYLENYNEKELESYNKYVKRYLSGEIEKDNYFPELSRFGKTHEPVVKPELFTYELDGERIWSQLPFAGTTIIPLFNVEKENFLKRHSFEISDIPNLIKLSKEHGKVQFGLASHPTLYEGLDFLDQIFEELDPPVLRSIPYEEQIDKKTYELWKEEFDTLASLGYDAWLVQSADSLGVGDNFLVNFRINRASLYARLKFLKLNDLTEEISNNLVDDPARANLLINKSLILTESITDALRPTRNIGLTRMQQYDLQPTKTSTDMSYPVEIGSTLMKKLTEIPSSYESTISVIDRYKQNDLYKLLSMLDKGVKDRNQYEIIKNSKEINETVENIWNDSNRLTSAIKVTKTGISLTIGLVGEMASSITGLGQVGLLAGLGFTVGDHFLKFDRLSEKIIKSINKDYIVNVYDFKQKYAKN